MMADEAKAGTLWNEAGKSGLILGLFTGIFIFTGLLTGKMEAGGFGSVLAGTVLGILLWFLKFFGCLWILKHQMLKYSASVEKATANDLFRFGMLTALTSAIIVAGLQLLNMTVISPDTIKAATEEYLNTYSSMMSLSDSDLAVFEKTLGNLPRISFFTILIYCFLYGTVASRIISRSIPTAGVFDDMMHDLKKKMHKENLTDGEMMQEIRREFRENMERKATEGSECQEDSEKAEAPDKADDAPVQPDSSGKSENDRQE